MVNYLLGLLTGASVVLAAVSEARRKAAADAARVREAVDELVAGPDPGSEAEPEAAAPCTDRRYRTMRD